MKTIYKVHQSGNLIIETKSKSEAKKVFRKLKSDCELSVTATVNGQSVGTTLLEFKKLKNNLKKQKK